MNVYRVPLRLELQPEGGFTVTSPALRGLVTEGNTVAGGATDGHRLTVVESPSFDRAKTSVEFPSFLGRWFSDKENALRGNRARRA
jgi:hypothetical protein